MDETKANDSLHKYGPDTIAPCLNADQLAIQDTLPTYSRLRLDQAIMFGIYGIWAEGQPLRTVGYNFYREFATKYTSVDLAAHVHDYLDCMEEAFLKRLMRAGKEGTVKFFGVKVYSVSVSEAGGDGDDLDAIPDYDLNDGRCFDYEYNSIEYDQDAISVQKFDEISQTEGKGEAAMRAAKLFRWVEVAIDRASFTAWLKLDDKTHASKALQNVSKRFRDRSILISWLMELMRAHPNEPISKDNAKLLAKKEVGLEVGPRPFRDAWIVATTEKGLEAWGDAGRRKQVSWFNPKTCSRKSIQ